MLHFVQVVMVIIIITVNNCNDDDNSDNLFVLSNEDPNYVT